MTTRRSRGEERPITSVGVVGLGAMGSRLAARLLDGGLEVHGTNRTASRAAALRLQGLRWHDTPREVAAAVEVVISMVNDDAALMGSGPARTGSLPGSRWGRSTST